MKKIFLVAFCAVAFFVCDADASQQGVIPFLVGPTTSGNCITIDGTLSNGLDNIACPPGPPGPIGPIGPAGTNGTNGTNGANGNTVLNGTGAPSSNLGNNGDFYVDTSAWVIYGPKAAGAWPATGTSLIGPSGTGGLVVNAQIGNYTIATTDAGKTVYATGGFNVITLPAVSSFPNGFVVSIKDGDTAHGKTLSGFPPDAAISAILWPGQITTVGVVSGAWVTVKAAPRWVIQSDLTLYVDPVNGNDVNDGLATTTAFKTIMAAYHTLHDQVDHHGHSSTLSLAAGTYNENLQIFGHMVGNHVFQIDAPSGATLNSSSTQAAIYVKDYAAVQIVGLTVTSTQPYSAGFEAEQFGVIDLDGSDACGAITNGRCLLATNDGVVNVDAAFSATANLDMLMLAETGGNVNVFGAISLPNAIAFGTADGYCFDQGKIYFNGGSFTGAGIAGTTGQRYSVFRNGVIDTNSGSPTYFPGSVAGSAATGGQYD